MSEASKGRDTDRGVKCRERLLADSLVVFLPRRIPQPQQHSHVIHHHLTGVIVEDRWDVFPWKGVGRVGDEEACLWVNSIVATRRARLLHETRASVRDKGYCDG